MSLTAKSTSQMVKASDCSCSSRSAPGKGPYGCHLTTGAFCCLEQKKRPTDRPKKHSRRLSRCVCVCPCLPMRCRDLPQSQPPACKLRSHSPPFLLPRHPDRIHPWIRAWSADKQHLACEIFLLFFPTDRRPNEEKVGKKNTASPKPDLKPGTSAGPTVFTPTMALEKD